MNWRGFKKHQTFGLRREWLRLWLAYPDRWEEEGGLGPRQVEALRTWLKTAGLVGKDGRRTPLAERFQTFGLDDLVAWKTLWVNVVFNFATARWYVLKMGCGSWAVSELVTRLVSDFPTRARRTLQNGIQELVGLLEHTPVGTELNQGRVERKGRWRTVSRKPYPYPSLEAVKRASHLLLAEEGRRIFQLGEEVPFPWVIFGAEVKEFYRGVLAQGEPPFSIEKETVEFKEED